MGDAAIAGHELLEQHGEFLSLLQFALEVDIEGQGADELDHRRRRRAGLDAALLQRTVALGFDAHDARAHLVDFLLGVVGTIVLARDDVLAFRLWPHRQRQHARRVRLLGHDLHQKLDRLADGELLLLQERLEFLRDLLAIGFRHVDVGQHLLDGVAALQPKRELIAVAGRRLGLGWPAPAASSGSP